MELDMYMYLDLHGLSSGMKAFTTWFAHEGIDTCRQSCGGHG